MDLEVKDSEAREPLERDISPERVSGRVTGTGPLLAREAELGVLHDAIAEAAAGTGSVVMIEGPAGIGKTSLLETACGDAGYLTNGRQGPAVLSARGSPLESRLGFGIVLQLFAPLLDSPRSSVRESLEEGPAAALLEPETLPESFAEGSGPDPSIGILHGLHRLVIALCSERPVILAIDDAQWADPPSLRFIHYLAHRSERLALAQILTVRTGEPGHDRDPLTELAAHPRTRVLTPQPLGEECVATIVAERMPGAETVFQRACARVTAGNPLYLKALIRSAISDGVPPTAAGAKSLTGRTPPVLRRELLIRLGRLPQAERDLARAASIFGSDAELHQVATVAELEPEEARSAADALMDRDILAAGNRLGFVHPIVKDAIRGEIPPAELAGQHLDAARCLAADGFTPEQVAVHLLAGAAGRDPWVVETLVEAATRARTRGAPESASAFLERALREGGGLDRRGEIMFQLGLAEATVGEARGIELISAAAGELDDPEQRALALMNLGRILGIRGRYGASAEVFAVAGNALVGTGSEMIWWAEAGEAMSGSHHPPARHRSRERLEKLLERKRLEDLPIGRSVLAFAALDRLYSGRPLTEALELVGRVTAREPDEIEVDGVAYRIAAMALAMGGQLDAAEQLVSKLEDLAGRQGSTMELAALAYPRMLIAAGRGDIQQLEEEAAASLEGARLGWGIGKLNADSFLALARLERDERVAALRMLDPEDAEPEFGDALMAPVWLEARGELRLAGGDPEAALEDFERSGRLRSESGFETPALSWMPWRSGAALALMRLGDRDAAVRLVEAELELAEQTGITRAIGYSLRTLGLVKGDEGIELLGRAVETHEASPSKLELARSLTAYGSGLRRSGQRRDSREPLRRALVLADECGSVRLAGYAEIELEASGARVRPLALSGIESLTPGELRVARLAGEGLTNRQIADELFLSRKTIEHHLSRTYRKLGIASRTELGDAFKAEAHPGHSPGS